MDRIRVVMYRDQTVLLVDCTNCSAEEVSRMCDLVPPVVTSEPLGSVRLLADFTGVEFSRQAVERLKIATAYNRAHIKRAAWVLSENLPKALYDSIRTFSAREIPVFATREEAMNYLVS